MKYISALAIEVFGLFVRCSGSSSNEPLSLWCFAGPDEGHHRIKHVTARNIELINAFIKVHQDISVVQRNFEHRKDYVTEQRTSHQQLPVFVQPIKDTTINEGSRSDAIWMFSRILSNWSILDSRSNVSLMEMNRSMWSGWKIRLSSRRSHTTFNMNAVSPLWHWWMCNAKIRLTTHVERVTRLERWKVLLISSSKVGGWSS